MGFLDLLSWIREGFATGQDVDEPDPEAFDSIVDAAEGESVRAELLAGAGEHTKVPLAEHLDEGEQPHHMLRAGEVVAVGRNALAAFESADNPDGNRPPSELVVGALSSLGWQLRAFAGGLRANPVIAAAGLAAFLVGQFGEGQLPGPGSVPAVLVILGAVALAYAGTRGPA